MWLTFDSITQHFDLVSRAGNTYAGWILKGTKKGFQGEEDEEFEKTFFDSSTTTVIEKGQLRPNCSVVQFFQKAVKQGDTVNMKYEREGKFWRLATVENISKKVPTYEPLPDNTVPSESMEEVTPPWM